MNAHYVGMRELWGTFSVRDHLESRPFVADLMLYDRLVVPVPADNAEWERWEQKEAWDPGRQRRVLGKIRQLEQKHDQKLVLQIPWDERRRSSFGDTITKARAAGFEVDGYQWTSGQLLSDEDVKRAAAVGPIKPRVVAAYVSRDALENELVVEEVTPDATTAAGVGAQQLEFAVGRSFLVPDADGDADGEERDLELVGRAAGLAARASFREKRAAYNDWVERAVRERLTTKEAVRKMDELLKEYEREVRAAKIATRVEQAFLVTSVAFGVAGHFFPPIWIGNVMLAPARYLIGREFSAAAGPTDPAAMFHEVKEELRLTAPR